MDSLQGKRLTQYHIQARIGQGGMGTVYRATHVTKRYPVALKILAPYLSTDPSFVRRFQEEYRMVRGLTHPNIVRVYGFGWAKGYYFIASEYIAGPSLSEYIQRKTVVPVRETVNIVSQIARALDAAHQRGIVHRDLKPSNVLLDKKRVLLTDFGIASMWNRDRRMQRTGQVSGTLDYMAPEQAHGKAQVGHRADIYALGVITYQMLTGHLPIERSNPWAMLHAKINEQPVPLCAHNGGRRLSDAAALVVMQALEKQPERRFDQAGGYAQELARATGIASKMQRTTTQPPRQITRVSPRTVAAGVLGALGVLLLLLVFLQTSDGSSSAQEISFPAGTVAYICGQGNRSLCIQSKAGEREVLALTHQGFTPAWSSDGRYLAYTAVNDEEVDIWLYDSMEQVAEVLTDQLIGDFWSPCWSPNTQRLAFDREVGGNTNVYVMTLADNSIERMTWGDAVDSDPAWSPDGEDIAFVSDRNGDLELYLMTNEGEDVRRLTDHEGRDFAPSWSPDGRYLAYECADEGEGDLEICRLDLKMEQSTVLTQNGVDERQPAWTPDGQHITFVRRRSGDMWDIWIMDRDGKDAQELIRDRFSSTHPTWKP